MQIQHVFRREPFAGLHADCMKVVEHLTRLPHSLRQIRLNREFHLEIYPLARTDQPRIVDDHRIGIKAIKPLRPLQRNGLDCLDDLPVLFKRTIPITYKPFVLIKLVIAGHIQDRLLVAPDQKLLGYMNIWCRVEIAGNHDHIAVRCLSEFPEPFSYQVVHSKQPRLWQRCRRLPDRLPCRLIRAA